VGVHVIRPRLPRERVAALAFLACSWSTFALADPSLDLAAAPPASDGRARVLIVGESPDAATALQAAAQAWSTPKGAATTPGALRAVVGVGGGEVTSARPLGAEPSSTALAFDQSGSFRARWAAAFDLAASFANATPAGATSRVLTFGTALVDHGAATDAATLQALLDKAEAVGARQDATRLRSFIRDAIERAATDAPLDRGGLRQVIVFTDAGEESAAYGVDDVVRLAHDLGVRVHVVAWSPGGDQAARKLDEVKRIAERTGGRYLQVGDDPAPVANGLAGIATAAARAYWVDLRFCGIPGDRGPRFDDTVEIELWRDGARFASTGPRPFKQATSPAASAPCGPAPAKAAPEAPVAPATPPEPAPPSAWPAWAPWAALALLAALLLALWGWSRSRRAAPGAPAPAPAPPPEPAAPSGLSHADPFAPVAADPLARLPELHLVRVAPAGPSAAPERLRLHGPTLRVGAAPGADLRLDVPQVSGQHATIQLFSNGNVFVRDDGSTNGTFVGDRRLAAQERVALPPGGTVSFSRGLTYRLERPADPPSAPPPAARPKSATLYAPVRKPGSAGDGGDLG
jgi:hypothetical protein